MPLQGDRGKGIKSPHCVVALSHFGEDPAELHLPSPEISAANSSPRQTLRHANRPKAQSPKEHHQVPHLCWWRQILSLNGKNLMKRLKEIQLDEMIDYHGGVLNCKFIELCMEVYDHVCMQGDTAENEVYAPGSSYDRETELPYYIPCVDSSGFGRLECLQMAAEYDVWQWYQITGENYSMLDALVWMGVHLEKLFSRPSTPAMQIC
mmetsp:Transcript_10592/g.16594  ORF Transcript_10592/g.16594 Transcript_10592/m.16594 type:complete len:207 (+) Transcript_10592:151-771(+)